MTSIDLTFTLNYIVILSLSVHFKNKNIKNEFFVASENKFSFVCIIFQIETHLRIFTFWKEIFKDILVILNVNFVVTDVVLMNPQYASLDCK